MFGQNTHLLDGRRLVNLISLTLGQFFGLFSSRPTTGQLLVLSVSFSQKTQSGLFLF